MRPTTAITTARLRKNAKQAAKTIWPKARQERQALTGGLVALVITHAAMSPLPGAVSAAIALFACCAVAVMILSWTAASPATSVHLDRKAVIIAGWQTRQRRDINRHTATWTDTTRFRAVANDLGLGASYAGPAELDDHGDLWLWIVLDGAGLKVRHDDAEWRTRARRSLKMPTDDTLDVVVHRQNAGTIALVWRAKRTAPDASAWAGAA